jgi:heme a synthase
MMVIVNDTLWRAEKDLNAGEIFRSESNWKKYPAHNYAKFIVSQTWTEYINRLVGALSSFCLTTLLILSLLRFKKDKKTFFVLLAGMFVLAFVIWLGKVVVDTNLKPLSITFHMMSALALVTVTIIAMRRVREMNEPNSQQKVPAKLFYLIIGALIFTLLQIVIGTQVRQQIDTINANMGGMGRETWIEQLTGIYLNHRLSAILLVLLNGLLFWWLRKENVIGATRLLQFALIGIILLEYGAGVFMHRFAIPAYVQPVHLLLAMILYGIQFALLMRVSRK